MKGVTYGTFAPGPDGYQFPPAARIAEDFRQMAALGINTVRLYTPPRLDLLDEASRHGLRVMVGLPWMQHVAFLDDRADEPIDHEEIVSTVRELGSHPAVALFALGNEIPPGVVRWHGRLRVERFLQRPLRRAKDAAPDALFTYVNFPPTEFLDLSFLDVCAFNVYLHREPELRAYLARLQHIAGQKPLLLAEAGADSIREGAGGQARDHGDAPARGVRRRRLRRGRVRVDRRVVARRPSGRGLGVRPGRSRSRSPKPAAAAVAAAFADAPVLEGAAARTGRACRWWSAPTTPPTRSRTVSPRSSA